MLTKHCQYFSLVLWWLWYHCVHHVSNESAPVDRNMVDDKTTKNNVCTFLNMSLRSLTPVLDTYCVIASSSIIDCSAGSRIT